MIYISSTNIKSKHVGDSITQLAEAGFHNIELSGGTKFYKDLEIDLLRLKKKFSLNLRCHNYFPPPQEPFVLNLSSLNKKIFDLSFNHVKKAVELSAKLGAKEYGVHGGFRVNPSTDELGQRIQKKELIPKDRAMRRFAEAYSTLKSYAHEFGIDLYVENNVCSLTNVRSFGGESPVILTHNQDMQILAEMAEFKLLLDVAHLKVSCNSLNLKFPNELNQLISQTDYIHISDNDGLQDSNQPLEKDSDLYQLLVQYDLSGKTFTIEVYQGMQSIMESYKNLSYLVGIV